MHALVVDSETGAVLIDEDFPEDGGPVQNLDAVGTYTGPGTLYGPVYHGVRVWVGPASRVHDWETEEDHVFVQWVDKSSSVNEPNEAVHTVERPLPGGGVYRFLVTVE